MKNRSSLFSLLFCLTVASIGCQPKTEVPVATLTAPAPVDSSVARPAWSTAWQSHLAAAKKEGKVMIYGEAPPELRKALTAAARQEFDLELEFLTGRGQEVSARFLSEWKAGIPSADVLLFGANTFLSNVKPEGALDALESLILLPEDLVQAAWPGGKLPFLDRDRKVIPLTLGVNQLLVVNSNQIAPADIRSYRDLLDPRFKGKMTFSDPTLGGTANSWVTLLLTKIYPDGTGESFLRDLARQEPRITRDSRLQAEWVARGEYPVGIALASRIVVDMARAGAPLARISAAEGGLLTGVGGSYLGLPARRPHPRAASVFLNWLLTKQGQSIFGKSTEAPPARLDVNVENLSPLLVPRPNEKLFMQDEDFVLAHENARSVAKGIFGWLIK